MKNFILLYISLLVVSSPFLAQEKSGPKFSGLMFGDYFYNVNSTSGKKDFNGFQFRRIYITTDYDVSDNVTSRFRLEADQSSNSLTPGTIASKSSKTAAGDGPYLTTATLSGQKVGVMVKDAWVKWKDIFTGSDFLFGISPTPAFDVSEGAWGHRYLEKTILDLNGIVSARDLGVDLKGKIVQDGTAKYWVKIGNNSSNGPESDKYKRFYGLVEFDPMPELVITVYGDFASKPKILDPSSKTSKNNSAIVGAGFIGYKQKGVFSVGLESYITSQQNNYASSAASALQSQTGFGISIWAFTNLTENLEVVARFDNVDPNTNSNSNKDGRSLILAGLDFKASKNFTISPNIEVMTYQADFPAGSDKSDVTPRVTFFWEF